MSKPEPGPLEWGGYIIRPTDEKHTDIYQAPNEPGIYAWYDRDGDLVYVGRSNAVATRLRQHVTRTVFLGGNPVFYSYRLMPLELIKGVEVAHIRALEPRENRFLEAGWIDFGAAMERAITAAWGDALQAQNDRLDEKYTRIAEQIAARL